MVSCLSVKGNSFYKDRSSLVTGLTCINCLCETEAEKALILTCVFFLVNHFGVEKGQKQQGVTLDRHMYNEPLFQQEGQSLNEQYVAV